MNSRTDQLNLENIYKNVHVSRLIEINREYTLCPKTKIKTYNLPKNLILGCDFNYMISQRGLH